MFGTCAATSITDVAQVTVYQPELDCKLLKFRRTMRDTQLTIQQSCQSRLYLALTNVDPD